MEKKLLWLQDLACILHVQGQNKFLERKHMQMDQQSLDKEVEGLQVQKDNEWFKVPIILHALLINAGDQVEIMSSVMFKSPVHRVVTNSERERLTLAIFCLPALDREIKPADELVNEIRPRLYKTVKDYGSISF